MQRMVPSNIYRVDTPNNTCPHLATRTQALGLPSDQAERKQHQHQHDHLYYSPLFSSNWLSLHATGYMMTQQIQHQEDGVKCDKRKNYKYTTTNWLIQIKTLYQQERLLNICKWVSTKLGIVSKDGSSSVISLFISK